MKVKIFILAFLVLPILSIAQGKYVIVIHGGAGTIKKENMTDEQRASYESKLTEALKAGEAILANGGASIDAVIAAVNVMEDSPLFNAGKGAVFNSEGKNEMDASIMDGNTLKAGAVAGVTSIKNPINAARLVMDSSAHVMMTGKGAEQFASLHGVEIVDPSYFHSERSWREYQRVKAQLEEGRKGTCGAVALDVNGNLAAATSTGGMTFKRYGRVGDSPIIGAGTYANNESCAVSCTGHGEYFIRNVVAYDITARMLYLGESLEKASDYIVNTKLVAQQATGGLVAVDKDGNVAMPFNTPGMYRGYIKQGETPVVLIYR
jgi:beta-aspartyl-peptidase (threonine type)